MSNNTEEELQSQMQQIIENGILKNIENVQLKNKVIQSLQLKRVSKLTLIGIDIILDLKFRGGTTQLKDKYSKTYVKLFAQLPQPKDEIINFILFLITYNIHWYLWKDPEYKEQVNIRFVYDCYHIMIFYSNGLYVSDAYIRGQIDKIFTSKFLEYERIQDQIIMQKKLEQKRKAQEKTFLGRKLMFPNLSGDGLTFAKHLSEKLKPQKIVRKDSTKIEQFEDQNVQVSAQTKYLLSHLQLNVNQVSPSVKLVLHMNKPQVPFSRPKMLQHNFEKSDEKLKFVGLLNNQPQVQKKQDIKYTQNILDKFNLRAPPKEYYQKFAKVDPLFKEMLELNYVLNNHQESLHDLYQFKELGQYEVQMPLSEESPQEQQTQHKSQFDSPEDGTNTQPAQQDQPQITLPQVQAEQNLKITDSINMLGQRQQQQQKQDVPLYQSKQKEYKQKYDRFIQSESTDNKINSIYVDLQKKQHVLMNHHHKSSRRK
ncbi:unnamed protein product [Paramecium octaurelia]|uniref:Uncharacterized protein n=1 Tax=Paramecium octaurelia TaxID=43137 RepID=A0A8S1WJC5_PAROT|nr:unnamed protein product [Paramecium octaurelia]